LRKPQKVEPKAFRFQTVSWQSTDPLHPVLTNNACPPRFTAAAGTKLAGTSSSNTVIITSDERPLHLRLLQSRGIAESGLRPLLNIPHCSLQMESGLCLSSGVADHSPKPAKHYRLRRPLPYKLHKTPRTLLAAINLFS